MGLADCYSESQIDAMIEQSYRQNCQRAVKACEDLKRYERIIEDSAPEIILELGSFGGGSALWFSTYCPVVTVDVDHSNLTQATLDEGSGRVQWVLGSSIDPRVVAQAQAFVWGRRTMVVLDSDHSRDHVLKEMEIYGPLVSHGCYMVVEDTALHWLTHHQHAYTGDPLQAVEVYQEAHPGMFRNNETIEGMSSPTQHPNGWLQRVG